MKKINENYYLDTDALNFILLEKRVYEKGKHIGEEYYSAIGFYGTIVDLYNSLINKMIRDDFGLIADIKRVIDLIDEFKRNL